MRLKVTPPSTYQIGNEAGLALDLAQETQMDARVAVCADSLLINVKFAEGEEARAKVRAALRERGFTIVEET